MKHTIIAITMIAIMNGCGVSIEKQDYRDVPFYDMNQSTIQIAEHKRLCIRKPDSIFCKKIEYHGDVIPDSKYAKEVLAGMNRNFRYTKNDEWIYNDSIHESLEGDCEDIISTIAKHMIEDGIDPKFLSIVYRKVGETESHAFLAVETEDEGLLHLDYANSGYKIEPQINYHMKMNNAGIDKWIKGNIPLEL